MASFANKASHLKVLLLISWNCTFSTWFANKLEKIADTVATRLSNTPGYHRQASKRQEPRLLDELAPVTVDEVVKLVRSLPSKSSPDDFMPTTMLKSNVDVMAPLIARLANMSFSSSMFPSSQKQGRVTPL